MAEKHNTLADELRARAVEFAEQVEVMRRAFIKAGRLPALATYMRGIEREEQARLARSDQAIRLALARLQRPQVRRVVVRGFIPRH